MVVGTHSGDTSAGSIAGDGARRGDNPRTIWEKTTVFTRSWYTPLYYICVIIKTGESFIHQKKPLEAPFSQKKPLEAPDDNPTIFSSDHVDTRQGVEICNRYQETLYFQFGEMPKS
jgi:hypothetical protein